MNPLKVGPGSVKTAYGKPNQDRIGEIQMLKQPNQVTRDQGFVEGQTF